MMTARQSQGAPRSARRNRRSSTARGGAAFGAAVVVLSTAAGMASPANAATTYPSDTAQPNLVAMLNGYTKLWQSSGKNDLHGKVLNPATLSRNDQLTSWINQHATKAQQFRALQNSAYTGADGSGYDQSISIADGLGSVLGKIYAQGRVSGALPLTTALINSETGTTGAYVGTGQAKTTFSYPRPYLQADPKAAAVAGDAAGCAPSVINSSSLAQMRKGKPWADAAGNLKIKRVAPVTDATHAFAKTDVKLDPGYGTTGICTGGSFPSGHTTTAYQAGITLATLVPELAPQILARASEAGNNRIVLGVHYPLDIIGGRMDGEIALATRWSDTDFRTNVILPAQKELVSYLTAKCTAALHVKTLNGCIARERSYYDNPYGGQRIPGGSAQIVSGRWSATSVYTERMSYGFAPTTPLHLKASVPANAGSLLMSTYPTLTDAQRQEVLAQTEIASGNPLDDSTSGKGSWQRLNLAAAMSSTVKVLPNGHVRVLWVGGSPRVIPLPAKHHHASH